MDSSNTPNALASPNSTDDASTPSPDAAMLSRLLDESRQIRGVSLWQDAWRRLKRNRPAMVSMTFLILLALTAFLTPALPLQSPLDKDLDYRRLLPPSNDRIVMGQREGLQFIDGRLTSQLAAFEAEIDAARAKVSS
ncbi:MAG: hypothetical protein AAF745_19130, partial [Planctomycetota bacterium]